MSGKMLGFGVAVLALLGMTSCDEGAHTHGECDATYQSDCLDSTHYMKCVIDESGEGTLMPVVCSANQVCRESSTTNADGTTAKTANCTNP